MFVVREPYLRVLGLGVEEKGTGLADLDLFAGFLPSADCARHWLLRRQALAVPHLLLCRLSTASPGAQLLDFACQCSRQQLPQQPPRGIHELYRAR